MSAVTSTAARTWHRLRAHWSAIDPWLRPASRANEVASLRLRLISEASENEAPADEVRLARTLLDQRRAMIALIGVVAACRSCARGYPLPNGRWEGGYCCGGTTENLFKQAELASLRAAGTQPSDLRPPRGDHAGCAFRGERGCSLDPAHRPNLCVRYACRALWGEFDGRGIAHRVRSLASDMQRTFAAYERLRSQRLDLGWMEETP